MISLKISISVQGMAELKTKIKLESDSPEKGLPFENLMIEALPSETEGTDLRLHFTNFNDNETKQTNPSAFLKKSWWQRFLTYYFPPMDIQEETNKKRGLLQKIFK
jgi:hypothetical protein